MEIKYKVCKCCNRILPDTTDYYNKNGKYTRNICKDCISKRTKETYYKNKDKFTDNEIEYSCEKICAVCNRSLPYSYKYFPVDKGKKTGLRNICRECDPKYKGGFLSDDYHPPRKWLDEDNDIFIKYYRTMTCADFQGKYFPNDSIESIMHHADFLGVTGKNQDVINEGRSITGKKVSIALSGVCFSDEHKKSLSISKINYFKTHKSWLRGDKSPFWKGGISSISNYLRTKISDWKRISMEYCHFTCVVCNDVFHNVHHVIPFNKILNDVFKNTGIDIRQDISDYSEEEIKILQCELIRLHDKYGYGACINERIHTLFHNEYGRIDFDEFDFLDFIYRIDCGEYDKWFEENNLQIKINYDYVEYLENILQ